MKKSQFTEAQIINLLQDAKKGEQPIEELCREFGVSTATYYAWKKKYGDSSTDDAIDTCVSCSRVAAIE